MSSQENDDTSTKEIESSFNKFKKDLENQTLATLLTGEYDNQNAILTFHAGAGGTEAQDWVEMLYRMYTRWCEKNNKKQEPVFALILVTSIIIFCYNFFNFSLNSFSVNPDFSMALSNGRSPSLTREIRVTSFPFSRPLFSPIAFPSSMPSLFWFSM